MSRLLILLALALAPLVAAAHDGHGAPGHDGGATKAPAKANGSIVVIAQAASRCPGGDHEFCCCHDVTCTPSFQPGAIDAPSATTRNARPCSGRVPHESHDAPRSVALDRHSPRGPPSLS